MNQELFCLLFKRKGKKSFGEFKRLCGIFLLFFLWTKVLAGRAVKLHFIQLLWHQAPGQERKCTIKCDLLENREQRGCEREKGREGEERENEKKGKEEIKACYWTGTNDWLRMEKWSSLEGRLSEICGMLDFQLWLLFLYNKECISGFSGFSWNSPDRTDAHSITHFTSRLWTALFGMKMPEKWHVYTLTGNTVDYQNDLWERLACLGLGQVYGMSIWGGGWGVTDPHNVRAQPGEKLEPQIVPNGKTGAEWEWWAEST